MLYYKSTLFPAGALVIVTCLGSAQCEARPVTYISGKGADMGICDPATAPCRTFQYAVNQTAAGGEVKALDPANYYPVTINKSITITGVRGAAIDTNGGPAISLTQGTETVQLDHLILQNVSGSGMAGIIFTGKGYGPAHLEITHCTIRGYGDGIDLSSGGGAAPPERTLRIKNTVVIDNGDDIYLDLVARED
jgi:hypothetical protein